ncbi:spermidine synthase [Spirochaetota bacterium]|nr:spermidine synthase [Spirochaetota bacterium]
MKQNPIYYNWTVFLLAFMTGACGMAYEYTFAKLASDLLGNTVHEWALTIAVMLFAMGIGADMQKRIPDKAIFSRFIIIEILLSLLGGWGGFILLEVFVLKRLHFTFVQMLMHFTIGLMIGMEIPLLIRMNARFKKKLGANLGQILRLDYWGGFIGALVWIYALVYWLPTTLAAAFLISICNISTVAIALFLYRHSETERKIIYLSLAAIFLSIASFLYGIFGINHWTLTLEQRLFTDAVIFRKTTPYQNIVLTESKQGDLRMYLNGHLQFSSRDEHIYHEMLTHPALFLIHAQKHPSVQSQSPPAVAENLIASKKNTRKNVLVLGGGDGLAVRELLKYPTIDNIVLVDIDADLIDLAQTHPNLTTLNQNSLNHSKIQIFKHTFNPLNPEPTLTELPQIDRSTLPHRTTGNQQIYLYTLDAYAFLKLLSSDTFTHKYTFDLIIADFPDPTKIELAKLYSLSFYTYLYNVLAADGVFVQQASSPYYAKNTFAIIGATIEAAGFAPIPLHTWIPSFGDWGWYIARKASYQNADHLHNHLYNDFTPLVTTRFLDEIAMKRALLFSKDDPSLDKIPHINNAAKNHPTPPNRFHPNHSSTKPPINTLLNHLAYKTYRSELRRFQ